MSTVKSVRLFGNDKVVRKSVPKAKKLTDNRTTRVKLSFDAKSASEVHVSSGEEKIVKKNNAPILNGSNQKSVTRVSLFAKAKPVAPSHVETPAHVEISSQTEVEK